LWRSLKAAIFMNKSISVFRVWFFWGEGGPRLGQFSFSVSKILHYLFIYLCILLVRTRSFLHSWTVYLIERIRLRLHLSNTLFLSYTNRVCLCQCWPILLFTVIVVGVLLYFVYWIVTVKTKREGCKHKVFLLRKQVLSCV